MRPSMVSRLSARRPSSRRVFRMLKANLELLLNRATNCLPSSAWKLAVVRAWTEYALAPSSTGGQGDRVAREKHVQDLAGTIPVPMITRCPAVRDCVEVSTEVTFSNQVRACRDRDIGSASCGRSNRDHAGALAGTIDSVAARNLRLDVAARLTRPAPRPAPSNRTTNHSVIPPSGAATCCISTGHVALRGGPDRRHLAFTATSA